MSIQAVFEGKIDFHGQSIVEQITRLALFAIVVISFILGFTLQSLQVTFGTFGASIAVLAVVVVPPWPAYNQHPVKWLPVTDEKKDQ